MRFIQVGSHFQNILIIGSKKDVLPSIKSLDNLEG
jgi:hypothetical protein